MIKENKAACNKSYPAIAGSDPNAQNQTRHQLHRVATRRQQP